MVRIFSQIASCSRWSQSEASPSVMLKTMGGKLSLWAGFVHHACVRSRICSSASYMGVCPTAFGAIQAGIEILRKVASPSGMRRSTTVSAKSTGRAASRDTGTSGSGSFSSDTIPSPE